MSFLLLTLLYFTTLILFFSIGSLIKKKINIFNTLCNIDITIIGYGIFIILSFHLYFILNFSVDYIIIFFSLILLIFFISNHIYLKNNKKLIFNNLIIFLSFFFIFFSPSIFYGEQFYVFRGNYWDHFNYLSSSMLFNKYNFYDLKSDDVIANYKNFQSISSIIVYRPFINFFQSLYLSFQSLNIFLIAHSFKIFLTFLNFLALVSFLSIFKKIKFYQKIIISITFSVSFFSLYVFETDALSHLGSISLFLLSIKFIYLIFEDKKKNTLQNILILSILTSSLFLVYPEIFCIFLIIAFVYLNTQLLKKKKLNFKIILGSFFVFVLLTISSYELNYKFLIIQFSQALNSNVDWWGYFGAFIFGKKSLVLDPIYVENIKDSILNKSFFELTSQFYFDHIENGYNYVVLNFIPSIFGLYYLTPDNSEIDFKFIFIFFTLFLNIYILLILVKNFKHLYKKKLNFIIFNFVIILIINSYFIINQNFWTIIKIYSYFLVFIYLFLIIDLKKEKINRLMLIMIIIFPIYKYSSFNNGIGKYDSFPSIIDTKYKKNINWNLEKKKLTKCDTIYSLEKDYFVNRYIEIKTIHNNKTFQNKASFSKNNKKGCIVSIIEKGFIVTSIK